MSHGGNGQVSEKYPKSDTFYSNGPLLGKNPKLSFLSDYSFGLYSTKDIYCTNYALDFKSFSN